MYLNDTLVTPSSNTYLFRAYVDTVLSYGDEAKNTQLTSQLWDKDPAGHMDATTVDGPIQVWLNDEGTERRVESSR